MKINEREIEFVVQDGDVYGKVHASDLGPLFVKSKNVRDAELGYDQENFCKKLAADGRVFEAVHVHLDGTAAEFLKCNTYNKVLKALATCDPLKGFRRATCAQLVAENPDQYVGEFDPLVGVVFKFQMTQAERLKYKLDHSQNRGLNPYELGLCIKYEIESGVARTNKELVCEHKALFDAATTAKARAELSNRLRDRPRLADPAKDHAAEQEMIFEFYKGRFQELQRIFTGPNAKTLMANYRAKIYGLKDVYVIKYTQKELNEIWSEKDPNVFEEKWQALREKQEKAAMDSIKPKCNWTKKIMEEKRDAFAVSKYFGLIIDGIFGDEDAQRQFTRVRDELCKIEKKMQEDPDAFWKFVG